LENAIRCGCVVGGIDEELLDVCADWSPDSVTIDFHLTKPYRELANFYVASNKFSVKFAEMKAVGATIQLPSLRLLYALSHYAPPEQYADSAPDFLVPTHLGTINSVSVAELMLISSRSRESKIIELLDEQINNIKIDKANLTELVKLLAVIGERGFNCVVRPHPAEFLEMYELLTRNSNAGISIDSAKFPIINRNTKKITVVSTSCTTLIEAVFAGRGAICVGADREAFLSSRAITPVSIEQLDVQGRLKSPVDVDFLRHELFLEGLSVRAGLDRWVNFLEALNAPLVNPDLAKIQFPNLSLTPYMRRRIGQLSGDLVTSYFSDEFIDDARNLNFLGNENVVVISSK
jgi:hypothetical protein